MNNICITCLEHHKTLRNICEKDSKIFLGLQKCVPEVEWELQFQICLDCLHQIENVCSFRELCIKSYLIRKSKEDQSEIKTEPTLIELCPKIKNDTHTRANDNDNTDFDNESINEKCVCYHCQQNFASKELLASHIKKEHNTKTRCKKKIHKCSACDKSFSSVKTLQYHQKNCHENISTPTGNDGITGAVPDQNVESSKELNICDACGTCFRNKYVLKRHINNVHASEKKFKCEMCDCKFVSSVYLNAHKRYHSGERKHICLFCGKGFITASDLYHHEKIHANKRAYRCEQCPKAFNTSSDLHKHKLCVHLDRSQWKYICPHCQKRFPLKTNLETHIKIHTGERNFLCHLCDQKCISRPVLKRHIESHMHVKSHKCSFCSKEYRTKSTLESHLVKIHHIDIKIPEQATKHVCNMS